MKALHLRIALAAGLLSAAVIGAASAMTKPQPQTMEWCAIYRGGSENCHFTSQAQCAASVSGLGGFCRMSYYPSDARR